ncbi:glycosyltransferase [Thermodesulfobacteriota bacterium]
MNKDKSDKGLSLIVPVYNEIQMIGTVLKKLLKVLDSIEFPVELIVVDDGSTDGTTAILESFSGRIQFYRHTINMGYGAALKTGVRQAMYPFVAITDADGTYPVERIPELFESCVDGDFDMTVGARVGKSVTIPLIRKPAKWCIAKLANYLAGTRIPDVNSGLRVMQKEVVKKFLHILPDGFSFTTTITLAVLANGHTIQYIPIDYFHRKGKSKIRPIQDTFNFIQLIIRTVLYFNPLRVFVPLSVLLVVFAFIVLFGSWYIFGKAFDTSFGILIMTAVMLAAVGMLADLINKRIR